MFARFTDRARKVLALANQEAKRLYHDQISPGHILAGLLLEGTGVGMAALENLGVDPQEALQRVGAQLKADPKKFAFGKLPHVPATRKIIESALEESSRLGHEGVGTEHLLLGLLLDPDSGPAQVLAGLGVGLQNARVEVVRLRGAFCPCGYPVGDFSVCPECGKPVTPQPAPPA